MRTMLMLTLVAIAALVMTPGVQAKEDPPQCVMPCDGPMDTLKEKLKDEVEQAREDLDPRNWPCTCDPQPQPW